VTSGWGCTSEWIINYRIIQKPHRKKQGGMVEEVKKRSEGNERREARFHAEDWRGDQACGILLAET